MGILDRLEKKRDAMRSNLQMKKAEKKESGKKEITVLLSPKTAAGEKRIRAFKPKNRYLKSYTVNDLGIGEVVFDFPIGIPDVLGMTVAKRIKAQIDEVAAEDIEATIFVPVE